MNLPSFIVNVDTGEDQLRFLRVDAALKLESDSERPVVESQMARVKDSVQSILYNRKLNEVQGPANMRRIQDQLWRRIDDALVDVKVHGVVIHNLSVN